MYNSVSDGTQLSYQKVRQAAESGDASAMCVLGMLYSCGNGVPQNYRLAYEWYKKSADSGFNDALVFLGRMYESGLGVVRDFNRSFSLYKRAAERGVTFVYPDLGKAYILGRGVAQNEQQAYRCFCIAAERGSAEAMGYLGLMYMHEIGVAQDYRQGFNYLISAVNSGFEEEPVPNELGWAYLLGKGVGKNLQEAYRWFGKSIETSNDENSMFGLSLVYLEWGNNQEYDRWIRLAAQNGDAEARNFLQEQNENYNNNNNNNNSSGCFITTAVCTSFAKSDDCYELTAFRSFRDKWLLAQEDGKELVARYYAIAPSIVARIEASPRAQEIYLRIWEKYLEPCLRYIEAGENGKCKELYVHMVEKLTERFK